MSMDVFKIDPMDQFHQIYFFPHYLKFYTVLAQYTILLLMKIKQQPIFELLQDHENYSLRSFVGSDQIKLRIVVKNRGKTNEIYDACVKSIQNQGKMAEYFQNFEQFNEYLKNNQNIKVDLQKKVLQIVSKGPTKKSHNIIIAQLKLHPIQLTHRHQTQDKKHLENANISSKDTQQWMDTLASQIVSIIEHKSRITQKSSSLQDYIKKVQIQQILQQAKKQVKVQMAKTRNQIQQLKQSIKKLQEANSKNLEQKNQQKQLQLQMIKNLSKKQPTQQQIQHLTLTIKQLSNRVDCIISQHSELTNKIINQQIQKLYQIVKENEQRNIQSAKLFCKKEEMDIIIKKIQQIGSKVQYLSTQTVKKEQDKEKLQDNNFLHKPLSLNVPIFSPKSTNNKPDLQKSFRGERTGNKKASNYIPEIPVNADTWIDPKCSHFGRVSLKNSTITINSYGGAHLFGKILIKDNSIFHIYIEELSGKIGLGVADSSYKQNMLFGEQPNKIYYQSNKRFIHGKVESDDQGEGYTKGQIITVTIDLKFGTILWKTGGKLQHSWQSDQLRNPKIEWVPYIRLFQKGDKIEILQ